MIVKCTKTGKILATEEEMKDHAEAFGVAGFEEVDPEKTVVWMNSESGKYCFTLNEVDIYCKRSGESQSSFEEMTVTEFLKLRSSRISERDNDDRVQSFANSKLLSALVDIKGYTVLQAEKALWYTRNESLAKAEDWLREHAKNPELNRPLKLSESDVIPESATPPEIQTIALSDYVDSNLVTELVAMGFNEVQATNAVLKTENGPVANAVEWLTTNDEESHAPLPDQIPLPRTDSRYVTKPKLSKEEAQKAALELQRKLREERVIREAADAREKERQRIAQTKVMMEHQSQLAESQRLREIAQREHEKKLAEDHKAEVAAKVRLDFIERFGYEPPVEAKAGQAPAKPKDRVLFFLNAMKRNHSPETVKNALALLRVYLANIESNSAEKKYHRIKVSNKSFLEKISPVTEAMDILNACGFEPDGEFIEIKASIADGWLCGQAVKYIDVIMNSL